jgi:hypothetical protein
MIHASIARSLIAGNTSLPTPGRIAAPDHGALPTNEARIDARRDLRLRCHRCHRFDTLRAIGINSPRQ